MFADSLDVLAPPSPSAARVEMNGFAALAPCLRLRFLPVINQQAKEAATSITSEFHKAARKSYQAHFGPASETAKQLGMIAEAETGRRLRIP
ncbi:MAG TPA: hypothetical protein VMU77_03440 [Acidimicrobiales bacterium]|nr:hypothetical protein [Acidimicrobiales bacterium]